MSGLRIFVFLFLALSACSLPRGAAIDREILRESSSESPTFSVVPVVRANLEEISKWAVTGWAGRYRWLSNRRGPASAIIKTGDLLDLVVWDSQDGSLLTAPGENSTNISGLPVSAAGTVFVPYVGDVLVRGLTETRAREDVQDAIASISPSAQVQLSVTPGHDNIVDMVTGVLTPGRVPLSGRNVTLLSLIAESGGVSSSLQNPLVRLVRGSSTYEIRADELFSNAARNITMRGGDKVIIEEDERYFVALGATGQEEIVYFNREHITTIEALSMLGGLAEDRANLQGILILREYPNNATKPHREHGPDLPQVIFTFDLTNADGLFAARKFRVNPKDTVIATESPIGPARSVMSLVTGLLNIRNKI
ncbi:MAG: polysaccharide export protein [Rhodobacteraceae bacterium]|nr:polysaccharide export protein [Paracoccaceae bacterium]